VAPSASLGSLLFVASGHVNALRWSNCCEPSGGCLISLGMESRFFVEAESFLFLVAYGSDELRMVEKRKGFFGFVLISSRCSMWLVSMVEEALCGTVSEDFVKSITEGSKGTMVRSGGNRCRRFLEVVVYAMGGR
jgi:hypothetical protein